MDIAIAEHGDRGVRNPLWFGAFYAFLFNIHHRIRKAWMETVVLVTFITAEPFLRHFGFETSANR